MSRTYNLPIKNAKSLSYCLYHYLALTLTLSLCTNILAVYIFYFQDHMHAVAVKDMF